MSNRDDVMRKVQGLLNQAASTDFGPEAEAFLLKADALMVQYMIDQWEIDAADLRKSGSVAPTVNVVEYNYGDLRSPLSNLAYGLAKLMGVKVADWHFNSIRVCGWQEDVDYYEMLFKQLTLALVSNMDPQADPEAPEALNVYHLKNAGLNWQEIWRRMFPDQEWNRSQAIRLSRVHKEYCERNDLPRVTVSSKAGYRDDFSWAFVLRVRDRMATVIQAREDIQEYGLVLANRTSDLDQWFRDNLGLDHDEKSELHKKTTGSSLSGVRNSRKYNPMAGKLGRDAGDKADIGLKGIDG